MSALHLDEAITGSLNYILAVPPAACRGGPEWRAVAERNDDAV